MSSLSTPPQYHAIGISLAIGSGVLIGSSFVFKKKGLLASQGENLGQGLAYLKNPVWWTGMILMILGELCNFGAYAFVAAIIVTPMGALSVVICAVLSSIFLHEKLSLIGWIGCGQCIIGSVIIALNAPEQQAVNTISAFRRLFFAPGFLAFGSVVIASSIIIIVFLSPKYGKDNMLWYISVCSLIGGLSVSCTQGLGACIITSIRGENQFKNWFIYFLMGFVAVTLITEIYFLNMALALFNTAMVTPVYFTLFTTSTLITSLVLYQGVKASTTEILTVVLGFLVICSGVSLLQLSKVDPSHLRNLDRRTTILLQAAREEVKPAGDEDPEKGLIAATEEPGMDALRGTFGGLGTISRARRRQSIVSRDTTSSDRRSVGTSNPGRRNTVGSEDTSENLAGRGVRRFHLHDPPMSRGRSSSHPPPSFPAAAGSKKRRDSHDSAAAVQGSIAGDLPPRKNASVNAPEVNDKNHKDSFNFGGNRETIEDGDLSIRMLLAQQQGDDGSSSVAQDSDDNPSVRPVPQLGTKHTTIQFVEPRPGHRHRTGAVGDIPPISHTPPVLSPQPSPPPSTPESGTVTHMSDDGLPEDEAAQNYPNPPPTNPPDEEPVLLTPYSQRRVAAPIARQILEDITESEVDTAESPGSRPKSPSILGSRHSRYASMSPSSSQSRSPTDDEQPSSRKSRVSVTSSETKLNRAGMDGKE